MTPSEIYICCYWFCTVGWETVKHAAVTPKILFLEDSAHLVAKPFFSFRWTILSQLNKVGLKCPSVHTYVRPSVRPQKVFLISLKFYLWVEADE